MNIFNFELETSYSTKKIPKYQKLCIELYPTTYLTLLKKRYSFYFQKFN